MKEDYVAIQYDVKRRPITNYPYKLATELVTRHGISAGAKLLEVGAGRPDVLIGFREVGLEVFGCDISPVSQKACKEVEIPFKYVELENGLLPYKSNTFDVVYSNSVIEHMHDPLNFVSESFRVLKPGGMLLVLTPDWEANFKTFFKDRIVETLSHYKIDIAKIKATVGPTVTLYEIVPAPGVRISKIKNLEDDIALSLSALGIRIIAPIPGKGTIGIEVPNSNPEMVSMRSLIASDKFQNFDGELPIVMGKTITNETYVFDLTKMPHLLVAGATGQGKSVGLNAILISILYKKHPAQVKFVLVDPKKVELTLFNKIERHFLAKLPVEEDAIITDTSKVVNTLNSLCIEMDDRY